jgi:alkylhydroperoxidase family enzyme
LNEAQIAAMDDYASSDQFDAQEKAVLRFAEQLTQDVRVDADTVSELKGFLNDAQMVVLAAAVGQANFTNRFTEAFEVELP